jgi:DinB superfamily
MSDSALREHLVTLLSTSHAHVDFDAAVSNLKADLRGVRPEGCPHSPWELVEHLRIAQWDIVEFSRGPDHASPEWPAGYWPPTPAPPDDGAWERSLAAFRADLQAMRERVADPASDLFTPFPWGDGQTLLREALLVADHNAYHVGQLVDVRRLLGAWPPRKEH